MKLLARATQRKPYTAGITSSFVGLPDSTILLTINQLLSHRDCYTNLLVNSDPTRNIIFGYYPLLSTMNQLINHQYQPTSHTSEPLMTSGRAQQLRIFSALRSARCAYCAARAAAPVAERCCDRCRSMRSKMPRRWERPVMRGSMME